MNWEEIMSLKEKDLHFDVVAYERKGKNSLYLGAVTITLLDCQTTGEALARAKELIDKPYYAVHRITECKSCIHHQMQLAQQRYAISLLGKNIEPHGH